jgi:hypothetical protein
VIYNPKQHSFESGRGQINIKPVLKYDFDDEIA